MGDRVPMNLNLGESHHFEVMGGVSCGNVFLQTLSYFVANGASRGTKDGASRD